MKCQYLQTIGVEKIRKIARNDLSQSITDIILLIGDAEDIKICSAKRSQCTKKKQPCEINRRCWGLG